MKKNLDKNTLAVHAGEYIDPITQGVNTPIFTSTAYNYIDIDFQYPRAQNTPNHKAVIEKLCALEKTEAGLMFGSGMGAISCVFLSMLSPGDHLVIQSEIYGGAYYFVVSELKRLKIDFSFVEDNADFESAIRPNTKLIYVESPSNPMLNIVDLRMIGELGKSNGILTAIDNTFATPINLNPIEFGIDIMIHSGSKYISGHSDIMCGVVLSSQKIIDSMFSTSMGLGSTINAQTCYLIERSLKTLAIRIERQSQNAFEIARFLEESDKFKGVRYPGLKSSPGHEIAKVQMKAFGAVVTFDPTTDSDEFVKRLNLIKPAMSLGGVESTITSPARTSHMKLSEDERQKIGLSDGTLRLSVGIENYQDLIDDLKQAIG